MTTTCRYALPTAPALSEEQVRARIEAALVVVVLERLPALRVGIAGEDTKQPAYVSVPTLDLRNHVEWAPRTPGRAAAEYDAQMERDMERENARPWAQPVDAVPAWRLVACVNAADGWADLCFAVHHALGDGKSGVAFHTHLVEVLNSADGGLAPAPADGIITPTALPTLVPAQETLVRFTTSWSFFVRTLWAELVRPAVFGKDAGAGPAYLGAHPRVSLEPRLRGHLRTVHLAPPVAAALLAGCRAHGTTLTALLNGLLMVLFARRVPADAPATAFLCLMPVSLRPYVHVPADPELDTMRCMANLVSQHAHLFGAASLADARAVQADDPEADDGVVWRAAAEVGATTKARQANVGADSVLGLMAWVGDWHQFWLKKEGSFREGTWTVSNVGSVAPAGETPAGQAAWTLTRSFYSQSTVGKDALVSVNVGGVRGGTLSLVVSWHEGVIHDAFGDALAADLQACLERFGETGHFAVPNHL